MIVVSALHDRQQVSRESVVPCQFLDHVTYCEKVSTIYVREQKDLVSIQADEDVDL